MDLSWMDSIWCWDGLFGVEVYTDINSLGSFFDIKGILLSFLLYACPTSVVTYHKRCFTLPSALKFCEYVVQHQIMYFFLDSSRKLITRMCSQGADTEGIQRVLTKMINRHLEPFAKFDLSSEEIASDVSSSST